MATVKTVVLTLGGAAAGAAAVGAIVVAGGLYDVSAIGQHTPWVHALLETAMRQAVRTRARGIEVPKLDDPAMLARGAQCYQQRCVQCHGAPGVAQKDIGQGMQPLPGPLVDARQRWTPAELYWITRNGIKMSGMPAWEFRLSEADLWAVVAFVDKMPSLSSAQYARVAGGAPWQVSAERPADAPVVRAVCGPAADAPLRAADAVRGRLALHQYACSSCHSIPGVTGSNAQVGPPLAGLARRQRIAGMLDNTGDDMVRWLRETQHVKPGTAMPAMGVTEQDARDITAYLQTLR